MQPELARRAEAPSAAVRPLPRASFSAVRWQRGADVLMARPALPFLVERHADELAGWYNTPHNRELMGNTQRFTPAEVVQQFHVMREAGGLPFLLFANDCLVGDSDLRGVTPESAEFVIMVGERALQGKGHGTAYSIMVHEMAFRVLGLKKVYLSIVPQNVGARRCYEKVGYVEDASPAARAVCDEPSDIAMRLDHDVFMQRHCLALGQIEIVFE